jgi:aspartokinase-like uncharacterized kinase
MKRPFVRVVKVGGSLLEWPPLPQALKQWLAAQPPAVNVLVCGGGRFADVIRECDRRFSLGEQQAHWLAIDCMSITARLLAALLPEAGLIEDYCTLLAAARQPYLSTIIFNPSEFLNQHEAGLPGILVPRNWSATSDSVAARLAEAIAADELVLLKSADPPGGSLVDLAAAGYVDGHFPCACGRLALPCFVNLMRSMS